MAIRKGERRNQTPNSVVDGNGRTWIGVSGAASAINRSTRTLYKLEKSGVLDRPRRVVTIGSRGVVAGTPGARWYSPAEIETLHRLAMETGFLDSKNRTPEFAQAVKEDAAKTALERERKAPVRPVEGLRRDGGGNGAQKSDVRSHKGWESVSGDTEPEESRSVRSWAELSGEEADEEPLALDDLPRCPTCHQELVTHHHGNGTSPLLATMHCPRHGQVDFKEPEPEYLPGPRTTADALRSSAAAHWGNMSQTDLYGRTRGQ